VELSQALGTVIDARIFVHMLKRCEQPYPIFLQRSANGSHVVLPRKWLLRLGFWIIQREPGVHSCIALVKCRATMPVITATLGRDNHRAANRAPSIGVLLRGANRKFLDGVR